MPASTPERRLEHGDRVEQRRLVLLEVALVRQRQALEQRQHDPVSAPMTRAARPRTSSAGSGFFLLGMIDEPVENASLARTNPNAGFDHQVISSASRLRWTMPSAIAPDRLDHEVAVAHGIERVRASPHRTRARRPSPRDRAGTRRRPAHPPPAARRWPAVVRRPVGRGPARPSRRRPAGGGRTGRAGRAGYGSCPAARPSPRARASSTSARSKSSSAPSSPSIARRSHRRRSVATWSLRERPVWSLPATGPIRSVSADLEVEMDVLERRVPGDLAARRRPRRARTGPSTSSSTSAVAQEAGPAQAADVGDRARDVVERPARGRPRPSA